VPFPVVIAFDPPTRADLRSVLAGRRRWAGPAVAALGSAPCKSVENGITRLYQELDIDRGDPRLQPRVRAVLLYRRESRLTGRRPAEQDRGFSL
jgi:hypothetical protein